MGSFFRRGTPRPWRAYTLSWALAELRRQLTTATPDGLRIETGDLRPQALAAMAKTGGLKGRVPATLLFVQT